MMIPHTTSHRAADYCISQKLLFITSVKDHFLTKLFDTVLLKSKTNKKATKNKNINIQQIIATCKHSYEYRQQFTFIYKK